MKQNYIVYMLIVIVLGFIGVNYYSQSNDIPFQMYMSTVLQTENEIFIIQTRDLPCMSIDLICHIQKYFNLEPFTFTAPSLVTKGTAFTIGQNNVGEKWQGSYTNTVKNPNTGQEGLCDKGSVVFRVLDSSGNILMTSSSKTLSFSTAAGICFASASFTVPLTATTQIVYLQGETTISGLGTPTYGTLKQTSATISGESCTEGWISGTNICYDNDVYQSYKYPSCSTDMRLRYPCTDGCSNGACTSQPECSIRYTCSDQTIIRRNTDCSTQSLTTCNGVTNKCVTGYSTCQPITTPPSASVYRGGITIT